MGDSVEYDVEKIIGKRKVNGHIQYKVKWKGYPNEDSSWEPIENLENSQEFVKAFDAKYDKEMEEKFVKEVFQHIFSKAQIPVEQQNLELLQVKFVD